MIYKKVKCYEVEIKILARGGNKRILKRDIQDTLNGMSYTIEHLKINIK